MKTIALFVLVLAVLYALAGCNGDGASPFDKPDESAQPVSCASSASCG